MAFLVRTLVLVTLVATASALDDTCPAGAECRTTETPDDATELLQRRTISGLYQEEDAKDDSQEDAKDDTQDAKGNTPDKGKPPAFLNQNEEAKYSLSTAHRQAGAALLRTKHGALFTKFALATDLLIRYFARIVHKAGQTLPAEYKDRPEEYQWEKPSKEKLSDIIQEWCDELAKAGAPCSDNPLEMEASMAYTRCLLEDASDAGDVPAATFVALVEDMDQMSEDVMPALQTEFGEIPERELRPCGGQGEAAVGLVERDSRLQSRQQRSAVAAAARVRQATERLREAVEEGARGSSPQSLGAAQLEDLWREPCRSLRCNPTSFPDILDAMQGLSAELVEVKAPARTIREHVTAMRKAHRLVTLVPGLHEKALASNASSLLQADASHETFIFKEGRQEGSERLTWTLKDGGGVLDAAVAQLLGSEEAVTTMGFCFGAGAGAVTGYGLKLPPGATYGAAMSVSVGGGVSSGSIKNFIERKCHAVGTISANLGILVGWVPNLGSLGKRAGLSAKFGVSINGCAAMVSASIGVGGSLVGPSAGCPFNLSPLKCIKAVGVGITMMCCKFNVGTGDLDCGSDTTAHRKIPSAEGNGYDNPDTDFDDINIPGMR